MEISKKSSGKKAISRKASKKELLLDAAQTLFSNQGFHGTQVVHVTKLAGVSVGTFYRHFHDKDEILEHLLRDLFRDIHQGFVSLLSGIESTTPLEQFSLVRKSIRLFLKALVSQPMLSLILFRVGYGVSKRIDDLIWKFEGDIGQALVLAVERVEATGLIFVQEKEILAHSLIGMVFQVAHRNIVEKNKDVEPSVDLCTRLVLGGLISFAPDESFNQLVPVFRMLIRPSD